MPSFILRTPEARTRRLNLLCLSKIPSPARRQKPSASVQHNSCRAERAPFVEAFWVDRYTSFWCGVGDDIFDFVVTQRWPLGCVYHTFHIFLCGTDGIRCAPVAVVALAESFESRRGIVGYADCQPQRAGRHHSFLDDRRGTGATPSMYIVALCFIFLGGGEGNPVSYLCTSKCDFGLHALQVLKIAGTVHVAQQRVSIKPW